MANDAEPERDTVMVDSVGLALLVVLESLTPAERLALVLHDVFGVPFGEMARVDEIRTGHAPETLGAHGGLSPSRPCRLPGSQLALTG